MSYTTQRYLRFVIPGMLGYFSLYFICLGGNFCNIDWPASLDEVMKLTAVFLIAFFYDLLPLRKLANSKHEDIINKYIITTLKEPFIRNNNNLDRIEWDEFKDIYYKLIDNDETLKMRSQTIRFNGTLWSSAADLRAISGVSLLILILFLIASKCGIYNDFNENEILKSWVIFSVGFISSFPISWTLTSRHRTMVRGQCNYIIRHRKDELEKGIVKVAQTDDR
ncbi:hypothetical protein [Microbaculum marinisediminis]|uniref:SMODS and SLOG-associating 2TM effector domain-containing protein n=1 Tax=Microbaculum marinisediminis TaxID=2931392 RepID=A0AAW5R0A4_9HYPH|nr:hypothetical protein [Microbaculum sp. A6E488]MCT8972612.1 hypothetical protein [Microbaculum sp. A6E488]